MEPGSGTTSFQDAGESSGCGLTSSGDAADRCKTEGPDQNEKIVTTGLEPFESRDPALALQSMQAEPQPDGI